MDRVSESPDNRGATPGYPHDLSNAASTMHTPGFE